MQLTKTNKLYIISHYFDLLQIKKKGGVLMSSTKEMAIVKFFKALEGIMKRCSSVVAFLLIVAWITWPSQINFKAQFAKGPAKGVIIDPDEKRKFVDGFFAMKDPVEDRANKLGNKYSPEDYYKDIKTIELWVSKQKRYDWELVNSTEGWLRERMKFNVDFVEVDKRKFSKESFFQAGREYDAWRKSYLPEPEESPVTFAKIMVLFFRALSWLLIFWLRSMPLMIPLYFKRIAENRGSILGTILADKKKFILAILAWPYFFFVYPGNWVREIIAETELRRLGNPFRRLSKSERKIVREVAQADRRQFKDWRADFRLTHQGNFKRGFVTALLITLAIIVFAPSLSKASSANNANKGAVFWVAHAPPGSLSLVSADQNDRQDISPNATLASEVLLVIPLALQFMIRTLREKIIRGPSRKIIHVPIFTLVIAF